MLSPYRIPDQIVFKSNYFHVDVTFNAKVYIHFSWMCAISKSRKSIASSSISQTVIYLFHYERLIYEITLNNNNNNNLFETLFLHLYTFVFGRYTLLQLQRFRLAQLPYTFDKFFKHENLEHECPSKRPSYPQNPRTLISGFESDGNLEAVLFKYDSCPMNRALVSL